MFHIAFINIFFHFLFYKPFNWKRGEKHKEDTFRRNGSWEKFPPKHYYLHYDIENAAATFYCSSLD